MKRTAKFYGRGEASGFTLLEVLTVVAITIVMMSIMSPTLKGVMAAANRARCASRLHQLTTAAATQFMDRRLDGAPALTAGDWGRLMPYLNNKQEMLVCPADDEPASGEEDIQVQTAVSPYTQVEKAWYYIDLLGPNSVKLSHEQFTDRGIAPGGGKRDYLKYYPGYQPGSDSSMYYLIFEDLISRATGGPGGDLDFDDYIVRVKQLDSGRLRLDFKKGRAGFWHHAVPADDRNRDLLGHPYNATWDGLELGAASASYGMNSDIAFIRSDVGKVFAIDYEQTVVDITDDWDEWDPDADGVPTFARHRGWINVAHIDGSVQVNRREEIEPGKESINQKLWSNE